MQTFSLLVKPASADCNLRCAYCFYLDRAALYPDTPCHRMGDDVLERLVSSYLATPQPQYAFGWQGGEPTLMGVDFFRRVTDLQKMHGQPRAVVANGLQTNATLLTDELAEHLAQYRFLVGVSLDGPAPVHDLQRTTADGRPTHAAVHKGIQCLRRHKVEFNILTLVNAANVGRGREVYRYLRDSGFLYHQYIPCVEFDAAGNPAPYAISGEQWGQFLCDVFDEWIPRDTRRVSIRLFDSILAWLVDGTHNVCHMATDCCQYLLVEHNGDVYPCDFFVTPELRLGNIMEHSWGELLNAPAYREFGRRKAQWNQRCATCRHLGLCAGDCLKHRFYAGHPPATLSWLCPGWTRFYDHTLKRFRALAHEVRKERVAPRG